MIEVKNVKKSYGLTPVLKGIDLCIHDGDFVAILGASGSGKSTLLNIMSGLESPDSGEVIYDGKNIVDFDDEKLTKLRKKDIGFVFQQYYLLGHINVEKNVKMGADLVGNQNYYEIIEAVGLKEKINMYPSELSGGEQQRVSLARAIAKKPKILFLDEPTGALDEENGRAVLDYICQLQQRYHMTIVMVTHNEHITQMANTVIKMNSGHIVDTITHDKVKTAYEIGW